MHAAPTRAKRPVVVVGNHINGDSAVTHVTLLLFWRHKSHETQ